MPSQTLEKILNTDNPVLRVEIEKVKNNPVFQEVIKDIKEQFFLDDRTHGLLHNERVAIYACIIGINEGLSADELRMVLEASLYHDIGRGFGNNNHGRVTAQLIDKNREYIFPNYNDNQISIIKALCNGHSVDDDKYEEIAEEYGIRDVDNFKKLLDVVKDADAIDRVRLKRNGSLDESFLRTSTSKSYIDFAKELVNEYEIVVPIRSNVNDIKSNYQLNQSVSDQLLFDGDYYYLLRSLNKADIRNIADGRGIIPKGKNKDSFTLQDILEQIRVAGHENTALISVSEDPNVVLTYDKNHEHRFVLLRFAKDEIENPQKVFSAGEYLLGVMNAQIERITINSPENVKKIIEAIDNAQTIEDVVKTINGADRQVQTSLIESKQQNLTPQEQLLQSKIIAKCKVLNYYGLMRGLTRDKRGKIVDISAFTQMMRVSFSNSEWLHIGNIDQGRIANTPKLIIDALAMLKQAEFQGEDKEAIKEIEKILLKSISRGNVDNVYDYQLDYTSSDQLKKDLSISKAYEMTGGRISYKDLDMQQEAIRSIAEMELNKRAIIRVLEKMVPNIDVDRLLTNAYCINPELVTRKNNKGSQIGKNISFIISESGYEFDEKTSMQILDGVKGLADEQLKNIVSMGIQARELIELLAEIRNKSDRIDYYRSKGKKSAYIAEAIVEGYDWKKEGNSLDNREKLLLVNKLLFGVKDEDGLYRLHEALDKITIGTRPFTSNEIFAIIINIALDGKIGEVQYNELLNKDVGDIRKLLFINQDSLKTSVSELSIDLLAKRRQKN